MTRNVTVAALQGQFGHDMRANIATKEKLIREAAKQGAQIILPSELFQGIYFCTQQNPKWFETAYPMKEHPCVIALQKLAAELEVVLPISFLDQITGMIGNEGMAIELLAHAVIIFQSDAVGCDDGNGVADRMALHIIRCRGSCAGTIVPRHAKHACAKNAQGLTGVFR